MSFLGQSAVSGREVRTCISGGDPGYTETAKFVSESALLLLDHRTQGQTQGNHEHDYEHGFEHGFVLAAVRDFGVQGGVLTPAFCFGEALAHRLARAGIDFSPALPSLPSLPGRGSAEDIMYLNYNVIIKTHDMYTGTCT